MQQLLISIGVVYLIIGVLLTAFCVHMSYHEAAIGFGDSDDLKAQKVLESKIGLVAVLFLFAFWPIAIFIAFRGKRQTSEIEKPTPNAMPPEGQPHSAPNAQQTAAGR